jgi:Mlc titration factor MtfA (ptsG expression regulator)
MLVTTQMNLRNRRRAIALAGAVAGIFAVAGYFVPPLLLGLALSPLVYWLVRRRCLRRLKVMAQPFPSAWEQALQAHVAFFRALSEPEKERFRQLVKIFLDEVRITGIRTEVDETVRALVAASAVIPIFGFHDWEYHRLGEVLVYPNSFGEKYELAGDAERNTLGIVGTDYLRGVMILSKPSLLAGFDIPSSADNVGIHEFTHLVELEEVERGLPAEVPWKAVKRWVQYVGQELAHPPANHSYISDYAYTNEHEYLAVLAEYFFKSPEVLREKDPRLYAMLREMFHQDPASLLSFGSRRPPGYDRSALCPCGSGKKYKDCCRLVSQLPTSARSVEHTGAPAQ